MGSSLRKLPLLYDKENIRDEVQLCKITFHCGYFPKCFRTKKIKSLYLL